MSKVNTALSSFQQLKRIYRAMQGRQAAYYAGVIGDCAAAAVFPLLLAGVLKLIFDAIGQGSGDLMYRAMGLLALGLAVSAGLSPAFSLLFHRAVKMSMTDLLRRMNTHLYRLPLAYVEAHHSGDLLSRMTQDVRVMERTLTEHTRSLVFVVMNGGGAIGFMLLLDWQFTGMLLLIASTSLWILKKLGGPIRELNDRIQLHAGRLAAAVSDLIAGFSVMKLFHIEGMVRERIERENAAVTDLAQQEGHQRALLESVNFLQGFVCFTAILLLGMERVIRGELEIGTLVALVHLQSRGVSMFFELGNTWANLQHSLAGAYRVFELLEVPPEPERYAAPERQAAEVQEPSGEEVIRLDGTGFRYAAGGPWVLQDISLTVRQGETIALTGPSGGGKSTLMKLLLGLYPPGRGELWILGRSVCEWTLPEWRSRIAYVPQESFLFEGSIMDNIRCGRPEASEAEIIRAAQQACAHGFILQLPRQYDTPVGERGSLLSGGQRQRIAIARAFLRDAPILLMDEATSALDAQSEAEVREAMEALQRDRTTVLIAHNPGSIRHADRVYRLEAGRLRELEVQPV